MKNYQRYFSHYCAQISFLNQNTPLAFAPGDPCKLVWSATPCESEPCGGRTLTILDALREAVVEAFTGVWWPARAGGGEGDIEASWVSARWAFWCRCCENLFFFAIKGGANKLVCISGHISHASFFLLTGEVILFCYELLYRLVPDMTTGHRSSLKKIAGN